MTSTTLIISVIGGLFVDHIMLTDRMPHTGESYPANGYQKALGGKAANTAVTAHRASHVKSTTHSAFKDFDVNVRMIGATGDDGYAGQFQHHLEAQGVDASALKVVEGCPTATCFVMIEEESRQNRILHFAGANHALGPEDFETLESLGGGVKPDLVICTMELRIETIEEILQVAFAEGVEVILSALAQCVEKERWKLVGHLIVNETEVASLAGNDVDVVEQWKTGQWLDLAKNFVERGVRNVVITLGEAGAVYANRAGDEGHVSAFEVIAIDPTGAGDAFTGAYAVERLRQKTSKEPWSIEKAAMRACKAGALAVTVLGPQDGIPWSDEMDSTPLVQSS